MLAGTGRFRRVARTLFEKIDNSNTIPDYPSVWKDNSWHRTSAYFFAQLIEVWLRCPFFIGDTLLDQVTSRPTRIQRLCNTIEQHRFRIIGFHSRTYWVIEPAWHGLTQFHIMRLNQWFKWWAQ